jgi:hypothetical protein
MFYAFFAAAVATAIAADVYDVRNTEVGLKAGVAVESFDWLVGTKPSATRLYLRDLGLIAAASIPALALFLLGSVPAAFGCLAAPLAVAARHIQGGLAWKKLLKK